MVFSLTSSALTVFSGHAYTRRFPSVSAVTRTRGDSHCVSLGHTELAKCLPATLPGPGSELYSSPDARESQSPCSPPCTAECRVPSVGGSSGCGKSRPEGTRRAAVIQTQVLALLPCRAPVPLRIQPAKHNYEKPN